MEARAVGRYLRVTPRKARYVLDSIRGMTASEALALLKFVPNEAARYIARLIESAIANAEHNYNLDRNALRVSRAYVDQGPSLKRIRPRAMGRAYRILKRTSHITVVLEEDESLKAAASKPSKQRRSPAQRVKKQATETATPRAQREAQKKEQAEETTE
ncbi:MAG: 50S ribosomal protein L22 [Armatimonadetes bacterium]|nr:50S ribosomal protein L22 [Armatimonadota bacterium]